jgi:NAD(P)H-dependent FMN reductase
MNIAIISGSHRPKSQSSKVAQFIKLTIEKELSGAGATVLDLAGNPLPLWDESAWKDDPKWATTWKPMAAVLKSADAFVVISPEWSGMVPPGLKNFFLLCGKELANKPALITAVSASRGGAYPVAELRMSSYKNTMICYIPEHIIVRNAESVLNDYNSPPASEDDKYLRLRISYSVKILEQYGRALKTVRESGVFDYKTFGNGM